MMIRKYIWEIVDLIGFCSIMGLVGYTMFLMIKYNGAFVGFYEPNRIIFFSELILGSITLFVAVKYYIKVLYKIKRKEIKTT